MYQLNKPSVMLAKVSLGFVGALFTLALLSSFAHATNLTVKISDIDNNNGHVLVALYQGEENYKAGKSLVAERIKASVNGGEIVFNGLTPGDYAVKLFHDANDNQKLDFNILGIPKEGYGFSNNGGRFGEPDFKEAKFSVTEQDMAIKIKLH